MVSSRHVSIFISYRRDDSAGHAGRLHDQLEAHFGRGQVFRDVIDIAHVRPGKRRARSVQGASRET